MIATPPNTSVRLLLIRTLALLSLLCCIGAPPANCQTAPPATPQSESKNILLLYSYGHGGTGIGVFDEGLLETLGRGGLGANSLFFEYLDLERNKTDPQYRMRVHDLLRGKYAAHHVDLVVTVQQPALHWLLNEGKDIAPNAPAITIQAPMPSVTEAGNRQIISQLSSFDIKGTLERALELFPDTRRVVFVAGNSDADRKMASEAARIAEPLQGKLAFEYTTDLSYDAMLKRVANLPPQSTIVFTQYNRDANGLVTVAYEVEGKIIKVANAPVFGLYDFNLRNGGIGGSVIGVKDLGAKTGQLALDLLNGHRKLNQPVTSAAIAAIPMFDWNQIQRRGGNPNNLTVQGVFVNRNPTFWEQYKLYVIGVTSFVIAQSLLIIALLLSRRRRKRAEIGLRHSQKTNQDVINGIPSLIYGLDTEGRFLFANRAFYDLFKLDAERLVGHGRECLNMPRPTVEEHRNHDFEVMRGTRPIEFEETNAELDGEHCYLTQKFSLIEADGSVYGVCGISTDITERKKAALALQESETHLRQLYASLQTAREEERRRLARELHDDLGQRVTALRMDLDWIESKVPATTPLLPAKIANAGVQVDGLADSVRRLIEDMRPGMLDVLGLVAAIEDYVDKFVARTGINCELTSIHAEIKVSEQIGIGIFRIVQEALNNVQKYAQATRVLVRLEQSNDEIALVIEDNGVGLLETTAGGRQGFGIRGMNERVSILNGRFSITSLPGKGVRIEVVIPT